MERTQRRDEEWVQKMLTRLKIICMIKIGDKLCTERELFHVDHPKLCQFASRMYNGENRERNLRRIQDTVQQVINYVQDTCCAPAETATSTALVPSAGTAGTCTDVGAEFASIHHSQTIRHMLETLELATPGLRNLAETYNQDLCTTAQIDCIISMIDAFLQRCERMGIP